MTMRTQMNCVRDCTDRRDGSFCVKTAEGNNCQLVGIDTSRHRIKTTRDAQKANLSFRYPRAHDWSPEENHDWLQYGCPQSWVESRFVKSVMQYLRGRTSDGAYYDNPRLRRCDDDLVLEAVAQWEHYDQTVWSAFYRLEREQIQRRAQKSKR